MTATYEVLIGLEVHVQLLTQSKLFCGCSTQFGMPPNSQTCPVCIGMPGVLPVMNRKAFDLSLRAALAFGCQISRFTKWDRKNYYYPDLPKAYQISQYDLPFSEGGGVTIETEAGQRTIRLIRIHLEEDAGKNMHSPGGDSHVDLNRTGTPLMEMVSEPDIRRPAEARAYLETVRARLRDLGISDCEMQEGSLRCDANVNLHITKDGQLYKTPIVEIKNMNSIRAVERALEYEIERQYEQWQQDGKVMGQAPKQTRGWDDERGMTRAQREKEEASDYRYFPEPDLVPVVVDDAWIERIRAEIGESAAERKSRYQTELKLSEYNAGVLVDKGPAVYHYFEELLGHGIDAKSAANWVINDLLGQAAGRVKTMADLPVPPEALAKLIAMVQGNQLTGNDARERVLPEMAATGKSAEQIAKEQGLEAVSDNAAIEAIVDEVIADEKMAKAVAELRAGKQKAIGALVGQVMKRSRGKFPGNLVTQIISQKLS